MPAWARGVILTVSTALMALATWMIYFLIGGQWAVGVAGVALILLVVWMAFDIEARQRDA